MQHFLPCAADGIAKLTMLCRDGRAQDVKDVLGLQFSDGCITLKQVKLANLMRIAACSGWENVVAVLWNFQFSHGQLGSGDLGIAFVAAARNGHRALVESLLDYDSRLCESDICSAFQDAVIGGHTTVVEFLLTHDEECCKQDRMCRIFAPVVIRTAFVDAARGGHKDVFVAILKVHLKHFNVAGHEMAFSAAVRAGQKDFAEFLWMLCWEGRYLQYKWMHTVFREAVFDSQTDTVKFLWNLCCACDKDQDNRGNDTLDQKWLRELICQMDPACTRKSVIAFLQSIVDDKRISDDASNIPVDKSDNELVEKCVDTSGDTAQTRYCVSFGDDVKFFSKEQIARLKRGDLLCGGTFCGQGDKFIVVDRNGTLVAVRKHPLVNLCCKEAKLVTL